MGDLEMLEESDEGGREEEEDEAMLAVPLGAERQDRGHLTEICSHENAEPSNRRHDVNVADVECASVGTTSTTDACSLETTGLSTRHRETLRWFEVELKEALDDPSSAEAVTACVEVILSDHVTSRDEVEESVLAVVAAEGLPEELALELIHRW